MFIEVIKAEYMDGFRLLLLFNNGERRIVDLSNSLNGTVHPAERHRLFQALLYQVQHR